NGSTDGTLEAAERFVDRFDNVRLLDNPGNRGKGYSIRAGVFSAGCEFVFFTDADLSTPIEDIETLFDSAGGCQVVIGSRKAPGSRIETYQPFHRNLMGTVYNFISQAVLMKGIRDTQCGFKLFTRKAALDIFSRVTIDGFGFDVEALYIASRYGYRIKEVPVRWSDDPDSRVNIFTDPLIMFFNILLVKIKHRKTGAAGTGQET
ncbi:MAG: dolichyl-phosphate beta-glucosyltransferase, partial [Pseudomonadota bacterium]